MPISYYLTNYSQPHSDNPVKDESMHSRFSNLVYYPGSDPSL